MNFIEKIVAAGFSRVENEFEKGKTRQDAGYKLNNGWLGLTIYHPDAYFRKQGFDGELIISLQGLLSGVPKKAEDWQLVQSMSSRYIRLDANGETLYETFSGMFPTDDIVEKFLILSK